MKRIILITGVLLCAFGLTLSIAQNEYEEQAEEIIDFAYGPVVRISDKMIVISEYDYNTEQDVEVLFIINAETQYENAESYHSIKSGDEVEIQFEEVGGQKIAKVIFKEMPLQLPEEADLNYENQKGEEEYQKEYIEDFEDAGRG